MQRKGRTRAQRLPGVRQPPGLPELPRKGKMYQIQNPARDRAEPLRAANQAGRRQREKPPRTVQAKTGAERPFGVVKRVWGYDQYLCRGKDKVTGETALMFLAFNFRRAVNILGTKRLIDLIESSPFPAFPRSPASNFAAFVPDCFGFLRRLHSRPYGDVARGQVVFLSKFAGKSTRPRAESP